MNPEPYYSLTLLFPNPIIFCFIFIIYARAHTHASVVCSNAKPKIADYAFTTVVPNLGVCDLDGDDHLASGKSLVLVDIPGLLEGAHDGVGLGLSFLRHVQRCRLVADGPLLPLPVLSDGTRRTSMATVQ